MQTLDKLSFLRTPIFPFNSATQMQPCIVEPAACAEHLSSWERMRHMKYIRNAYVLFLLEMFRNRFPMPLWLREPMEFDIKVTKARRKPLTKARCLDRIFLVQYVDLCGLFWVGVKFGVVDYIAVGSMCCFEYFECPSLWSSLIRYLWKSLPNCIPQHWSFHPFIIRWAYLDQIRIIRAFTLFHLAPDLREVKIGHRRRSDWWLWPPY